MTIKRIRISNFKSFKDLELELGNLNVLIGANASGKSNFIQVFKFLRDIKINGLDNAISMQGGIEYMRNIAVGASKNLSLEVAYHPSEVLGFTVKKDKKLIRLDPIEVTYKLNMSFKRRGLGFEIPEERFSLVCKLFELEKQNGKTKEKEELGPGEIIIAKAYGKLEKLELKKSNNIPVEEEDVFSSCWKERRPSKELLIEFLHFPVIPIPHASIYDFDPKLPKRAIPITGKAELEEDGNNLAIALNNILKDRDRKRKFSNLIKDLLPFVEGIDTEKFADKSLLFKLKESYFRGPLPASLISDGTINITALIMALYFDKNPLTIIEEPERNIHPHLISKVIEMMKEASKDKQIVVTTHNPEVVRYAGLENILLVSRDKKGFSTISRPADKEEVKTFLKNEIGIEELYVQDLLGV